MKKKLSGLTVVTFIAAGLLLLAAAGCESDKTVTDPVGGDTWIAPLVADGEAGRNQLVANLVLAYTEMNYQDYERGIESNFVFRVDPNESDIIGQSEFSAAEDLQSTLAMFSGETGLEPQLDKSGNPTGSMMVVPPVQAIQMVMTPVSNWALQVGGEFNGAWRGIFDAVVEVSYSGSNRMDQIRGRQVFYAVDSTILTADEEEIRVWQLRGWEDQGVDSGIVPAESP